MLEVEQKDIDLSLTWTSVLLPFVVFDFLMIFFFNYCLKLLESL